MVEKKTQKTKSVSFLRHTLWVELWVEQGPIGIAVLLLIQVMKLSRVEAAVARDQCAETTMRRDIDCS